jgi:hypothetical protein
LYGVDEYALRGGNCSPSGNDDKIAPNIVTHEIRSGAFHSMLTTAEHALVQRAGIGVHDFPFARKSHTSLSCAIDLFGELHNILL